MKTSPPTPADWSASVIAVPPLARAADLSIAREPHRALVRHLESAGVRTLMYGGSANFYHLPTSAYAEALDAIEEAAGAQTWVIPAAGPDYGKLMDQAAILRGRAFPAVMALPFGQPSDDRGVATALRHFAEACGKPVIAYLREERTIEPDTLARVVRDGLVCGIKYAIARADPSRDDYLDALLAEVDADIVVSGLGERPAVTHFRQYGLTSFTSGSACVAPRGAMRLLQLLASGDFEEAAKVRERYLPLEDLRDRLGAVRVLHDAVTLAGIADMGPCLPMVTNLGSAERDGVRAAARELTAFDRTLA